jgi:MoaA/NifB/PqqE/SkfB family radical SAM enzyme
MKTGVDCGVSFFVSSSGHCTLDCPYCIIDPIAKREPSLDYGDIAFLLDTFKTKVFLAFSGKGDFFAGYRRSERLLSALLHREVEIGLDINGVLIHEFSELTPEQLEKIRSVNLTMHYQQIKEKNLQKIWAENAKVLIDRKGCDMLLGTIISPLLMDLWEESLLFYDREIFSKTGKKIVLVRDINRPFDEEGEALLMSLKDRFSDSVERIHQEDFEEVFRDCDHVLCPAGRSYFRIWNNGDIQGCPNIPKLARCGNVKERNIAVRDELFRCSQTRYCDCNIIEALGKMIHC